MTAIKVVTRALSPTIALAEIAGVAMALEVRHSQGCEPSEGMRADLSAAIGRYLATDPSQAGV